MSETWSIDDVARTSEETVVRRRFDRRNRFWLFLLLLFFGLVSIIEMFSDLRTSTALHLAVGTANFIVVALALFLIRDVYRYEKAQKPGIWGPAAWIRNHTSAATITFIALQYALVLAYPSRSNEENWVGWVMVFPFLVLAFRMVVAELVLMHALIAAGAVVMILLASPGGNVSGDNPLPFLISALVINVICLGIELLTSRRLRRSIVEDWSARRASAQEQVRMRDELRYARELQLSMLPEAAPQLEWVELAGVSLPATEVGGDYYDYFVDTNRVAIVCGDVAGHGMASGIVLSAMRSGFTLLRDSLGNPASVLKRLHDLVAETSRRRMLVTVSVVLLDRDAKRATVASAGHPPVVVRRADGSVSTLDLYAPPLGVRLPVDIPQRSLDVFPGDLFVLHSDGVYECRNEREEVYGLDRLCEVVRTHDGSAEALRDAILADVERFRGSEPQGDDVTVVVARMVT